MSEIKLTTPVDDALIKSLKIGDRVLINGVIYTGRDAAHKRMIEALDRGEDLPVDIRGQIIYYAGPSPTPPGKPIGSVGPTTSYRMDPYAPRLMEAGLKGMIGKGPRAEHVRDAMVRFESVYFAAIGGAAALLARQVKVAEIVAFEELGPEAIRRLEVEDFPVIVVNDTKGSDLFTEGVNKYAKEL